MSITKSEITVYNKTKDSSLGSRIQVADSSLSRLFGLLGKRSLVAGSGLLIFPSNSIHTIGMFFSIDVIFLDRKFRVLDLCETLPPFRVTWPRWKARCVLELPAHTIHQSQTEVGDELVVSGAIAPKGG